MSALDVQFADKATLQKLVAQYGDIDVSACEAAVAFFHMAHAYLNISDGYFQRHGLSHTRFRILMTLMKEGPMSPARIAERMNVSRATLTGLMDTLLSDDFITKKQDAEDRRAFSLEITKVGKRKMDEFLPQHFRRIAELMAEFSNAERKTFVTLMKKLAKGLPAFA